MYRIIVCGENVAERKRIFDELRKFARNCPQAEIVECKKLNLDKEKQAGCSLLFFDASDLENSYLAMRLFRASNPKTILVYYSYRREPEEELLEFSPYCHINIRCSQRWICFEIEKVLAEMRSEGHNKKIVVHYQREIYCISLDDILYIENKKHGSRIYEMNKMEKCGRPVKEKITELEVILQKNGFLRTHNSFLVNCQYVRRLQKKSGILLCDGSQIPISKARAHEFFQRFQRYQEVLTLTNE